MDMDMDLAWRWPVVAVMRGMWKPRSATSRSAAAKPLTRPDATGCTAAGDSEPCFQLNDNVKVAAASLANCETSSRARTNLVDWITVLTASAHSAADAEQLLSTLSGRSATFEAADQT